MDAPHRNCERDTERSFLAPPLQFLFQSPEAGVLAMPKIPDDTAEVVFGQPAPITQPPSVDPAVLRRALQYGLKCRVHFPTLTFREVEPELRSGWERKGETTEWDWVRAAVRAGFDQEPSDDE
jgi:hypothetical protein